MIELFWSLLAGVQLAAMGYVTIKWLRDIKRDVERMANRAIGYGQIYRAQLKEKTESEAA